MSGAPGGPAGGAAMRLADRAPDRGTAARFSARAEGGAAMPAPPGPAPAGPPHRAPPPGSAAVTPVREGGPPGAEPRQTMSQRRAGREAAAPPDRPEYTGRLKQGRAGAGAAPPRG